jgi:uncharacterized protein YdcH (DUF465 family)
MPRLEDLRIEVDKLNHSIDHLEADREEAFDLALQTMKLSIDQVRLHLRDRVDCNYLYVLALVFNHLDVDLGIETIDRIRQYAVELLHEKRQSIAS